MLGLASTRKSYKYEAESSGGRRLAYSGVNEMLDRKMRGRSIGPILFIVTKDSVS